MNLIIDERLSKMYKGFIRENSDITEITVHGSGGGTGLGLIDWMSSPKCERADNYKKNIGLFPYAIDRDGTVFNIMPDEDWYYHSEAGSYDKHTIGIEMVNPKASNSADYTDEQYQSLVELIIYLIGKYSAINKITSHDYNRAKYSKLPPKPCPGPQFDWPRLVQMISDENDLPLEIGV